MTPLDTTPQSQTKSVSLEFELHHSPQKVWRALTDPALLSEWLLPIVDSQLQLEPGAAFAFQVPPDAGWADLVQCRMLEIETHRKLSYTWATGDLNTVVTFTLTPTDSGTRLSLVQTGFEPHQKNYFGGARYGWKRMGEQLVELLGRTP